jgi:hypothetical protein
MSKILAKYLIAQRVVQGATKERINNSSLSTIKSWLVSAPIKVFAKHYQLFGREFHKRCLEPHKRKKKLSAAEEKQLSHMIPKLLAHPVFKSLMQDSKKEELVVGVIEGVEVQGTLDILKGSIGGDPKTTSTPSLSAFIRSMISYDYHRQAWIYSTIAKLKEFYFFPSQKLPPYAADVVDAFADREAMKYAEAEARFLLSFYRVYGLPVGIKIVMK